MAVVALGFWWLVPASAADTPAATPAATLRHHATEQEWLVADIVGTLVNLSHFAQPSRADDPPTIVVSQQPNGGRFDQFIVTIGATPAVTIGVVEHIWSPRTYEDLARTLFAGNGRVTDTTEGDLNVRAALTDPSTEVMLQQDDRIAQALKDDMGSSSANESAALLAGVLALRESTTVISDIRPALSRMAAHLAIANARRGSNPASTDGLLAQVILSTLAGREREASALLADAQRRSADNADRAWTAALQERLTGDWRRTSPGPRSTILERLEHGRALRQRLGIAAFLTYFDQQHLDDRADWHRIAFTNEHYSVEASHEFAEAGTPLELDEIDTVWSHLYGSRLQDRDVVPALNRRFASGPVHRDPGQTAVHVLDWGIWAGFLERHLCQTLVMQQYHFDALGLHDEEKDIEKRIEADFGDLTLYPIVLRWMADGASEQVRAVELGAALVKSAPEIVPAAAWNYFMSAPNAAAAVKQMPLPNAWFTPAEPVGTGFDLRARSLQPGCPRPPTRAQAAAWAESMPYNQWTQWSNAWLSIDGSPSIPELRHAFGPLLDYDVDAIEEILDYAKATPDEHIAFAGRLCDLVGDDCDRLARLLLLVDRSDDAAAAYEKWIAGARDRVKVSNDVMWVVKYYEEHHNGPRALAIATRAASTGSAGGMRTLAELLDREGQHDRAQALAREIETRYGITTTRGVLMMRQALRTGDTALERQASDLLRDAFPRGAERLVVYALDAQPTDGATFQVFGTRAAALGLRATDIIVGVDEWRVHTTKQYEIAARVRPEPAMLLTVWRDGRYQQLHVDMPERAISSVLQDYHAHWERPISQLPSAQ